MADIYDNWERLVNAVLRRESDKQLALNDSREPSSIGSPLSTTSDFSDQDQYSFVQRQRSEVHVNYPDVVLSHSEWKAKLPPDQHELVFRSASLSFFLDKRTGKNCFILGAMRIQYLPEMIAFSVQENSIELQGRRPQIFPGRWERKPHPKSRFLEAAEVLCLYPFDIKGEIHAEMLSPYTTYAIYLVFGSVGSYKNLKSFNCKVTYLRNGYFAGGLTSVVHFRSSNHRADGWMEIEIGSFHVPGDLEKDTLEARLENTTENMEVKSRLIVEGIEFRPWRAKGIFSNFSIFSKV